MARPEYRAVRAKHRQRQQRVAAFVIVVLLAIMSLGILTSCGPSGVALDPRDVEAVEAIEDRCDRTSTSVELKILNRGSAAVEVWLYSRSGGRRHIGIVDGFGRRLKTISRHELEVGGTLLLRQASGLSLGDGEYLVPIGLLSCDVGLLEIGASLPMSQYIGMDFHPDLKFRR